MTAEGIFPLATSGCGATPFRLMGYVLDGGAVDRLVRQERLSQLLEGRSVLLQEGGRLLFGLAQRALHLPVDRSWVASANGREFTS